MNACRRVCGLTCLAIPARRVTRRTIRAAPCRSSRRPSAARDSGPAAGFELAGEGLDVGAADREERKGPGAAPAGELAQVEGVGVAGQAAVPGQVPGEREPLGISEHRLDRGEGSRGNRVGHHGTSGDSRDPEGWAPQVPAMNGVRNVRRQQRAGYTTVRQGGAVSTHEHGPPHTAEYSRLAV
jgi:hypothetical protein